MSDTTVEDYCDQCRAERPISKPVSWQDDVCATCGSSDVELEAGGLVCRAGSDSAHPSADPDLTPDPAFDPWKATGPARPKYDTN